MDEARILFIPYEVMILFIPHSSSIHPPFVPRGDEWVKVNPHPSPFIHNVLILVIVGWPVAKKRPIKEI